jgi:hypothetical protein
MMASYLVIFFAHDFAVGGYAQLQAELADTNDDY